MQRRLISITCLLFFLFPALVFGDTDTLLILHTNDIHDHLRPGYEGVGGMPYVSGYISQVKAQRDDTLVLDGGDVTEKGDMVAFMTKSELTFEAMGRIGYDACAVGNHDFDQGVDHLRKCRALAQGMSLLCINWIRDDGTPEFPPSRVFDVDGVNVGVIGVTVPQDVKCLNLEETARALVQEAEALEEDCQLLVALCHLGTKDCRILSLAAKNIDLFVGGHSHQSTAKPVAVEETGALIVQAGQHTEKVGRLELCLDLDTEAIVGVTYELVEMRHDGVPCDREMLEWIEKREKEICPQASRVVGFCEDSVGGADAGRLAAAALRERGDAEVGFCHPGNVIRSGLPKGDIDVNALFRTGGQRGHSIVTAGIPGKVLVAYLNGLETTDWGQTVWAGFGAEKGKSDSGDTVYETNLDGERVYQVVMPRLEWDQRFMKYFKKEGENLEPRVLEALPNLKASPSSFSFTDAVTAYVEEITQHGTSIDARVRELKEAVKLEEMAVK